MWAPPIGLIYTAGLALIQNSDSKYLIPIHVGVSWALVNILLFYEIQKLNKNYQNKLLNKLAQTTDVKADAATLAKNKRILFCLYK